MQNPYTDTYTCRACGRYIGLHTRDGVLVGLEYHGVHMIEVEARLIGAGTSGLGMWSVKRQLICDWRG